jgi:hypothetical protein
MKNTFVSQYLYRHFDNCIDYTALNGIMTVNWKGRMW